MTLSEFSDGIDSVTGSSRQHYPQFDADIDTVPANLGVDEQVGIVTDKPDESAGYAVLKHGQPRTVNTADTADFAAALNSVYERSEST